MSDNNDFLTEYKKSITQEKTISKKKEGRKYSIPSFKLPSANNFRIIKWFLNTILSLLILLSFFAFLSIYSFQQVLPEDSMSKAQELEKINNSIKLDNVSTFYSYWSFLVENSDNLIFVSSVVLFIAIIILLLLNLTVLKNKKDKK